MSIHARPLLAAIALPFYITACGPADGDTPLRIDRPQPRYDGLTVTEVLDDGGNHITFYDYDSDGTPDAAVVDAGADGSDDGWWFDSDDDGRWDRHVWDTDDDGVPDVGEMDWNGDGNAESYWTDLDGDGKLDPGESIDLEERPFFGPGIDDGEVLDVRKTSVQNDPGPTFVEVTDDVVTVADDDIPVGQPDVIPDGPSGCVLANSQYRYGLEEKCIAGFWHDKARYEWSCNTAPTTRETFEWIPSPVRCAAAIDAVALLPDEPEEELCLGGESVVQAQTWMCVGTWQLIDAVITICPDDTVLATEEVSDTFAACAEEGTTIAVNEDESSFDSDTCPTAMLLEESEGFVCLGGVGQVVYSASYGCADGSLEQISATEVSGDC